MTFGENNFNNNLAFIEEHIGKDIRKYFIKDFYPDHIKRYKKRPIYWMFSSPKGSFNVLIYMHRYTPDTVSNILNKYLKELCQLAELVEPTVLTRTKAGKRVQEVWKKSDLITTHTARRSFATNAFKMGVPSLSIMLITGHRTEKSFMRYIKIQREENAVLMAQNPFFRGETYPGKTERDLVEEIIYSRN